MMHLLKFLGVGVVIALFGLLGYSAYRQFSDTTGLTGAIGGPFTLIDQTGHTVTDRDFRGRWLIVYFGYTHCPDACPTALNNIANALDQLGGERKKVAPIFVTIDPERDTSKVLKDYLASFGTDFIGLTGSQSAIDGAEVAYHVYAAKHVEPDGGYDMDHSSVVYIMDPTGRFVTNFTDETDPTTIATKLKALLH